MLRALELRLDNVVYRSGWASTRPQARQFVSHGHVLVNGKRVNVPSYRVRKGDVVEVKEKTRTNPIVQWNKDVLDRTPPAWLERGDNEFAIKVYSEPIREQIDVPLRSSSSSSSTRSNRRSACGLTHRVSVFDPSGSCGAETPPVKRSARHRPTNAPEIETEVATHAGYSAPHC